MLINIDDVILKKSIKKKMLNCCILIIKNMILNRV
jgi:hypothetical protein